MSVIDPGPDRYYGRRGTSAFSGSATLTDDNPRLDVLIPASLLVLLALGHGPLHAYGVMRQVEKDSGARMGKATVHGTLERLEEAGWVDGAGGPESAEGRTFVMTAAGRNALRGEIGRIHRLAALARERRILT